MNAGQGWGVRDAKWKAPTWVTTSGGSGTSDGAGHTVVSFTLPGDYGPGTYTIKVEDDRANYPVYGAFTIMTWNTNLLTRLGEPPSNSPGNLPPRPNPS